MRRRRGWMEVENLGSRFPPGVANAVNALVERLNGRLRGERGIRIGRDRVYVDTLDRFLVALGWRLGWLARAERELIAREVKPRMVTVDVGANIGLYTLAMARWVGPSGRVYAIEPEAHNFHLLSRAVSDAGLSQVELRQVAAADHTGWMTLYLSETNRGDHRIFPAEADRPLVTVRALRLDDLLADEAGVDFIKLHVRGAEVSVLRGLRQTLSRNPHMGLLCNVCPELLRRAGSSAPALFEPLRAAGFAPHVIAPSGIACPVNDAMAWSTARASGAVNLYFRRLSRGPALPCSSFNSAATS